MKEQEGEVDVCHGTKVLELMLLLPTHQFFALEQAASQQNLSVGRLVRLAISDFLRQPGLYATEKCERCAITR